MSKPWPWLGDAAAIARRRDDLWRLLGPRPTITQAPHGKLLRHETSAVASIEHWTLALNDEEPVPALLLRPLQQPARGVVLYCHAHGNRFAMGKDELLAGRPALASPPYGELLPALGYAVLAIDHFGFGERSQQSERALVKRLLWQGRTLWGYRVHDSLAALDWLLSSAEFATLPVTTLGLSMGSSLAVWCSALDERIAQCIDLCCLSEYDALLANGGFDLHGEYFFVPGLTNEFAAAEISALIAPRRHLSCAGRDDPLTPLAGLAAVNAAMREAYSALSHAENWQQSVFPCGHQESPDMRRQVIDFLKK